MIGQVFQVNNMREHSNVQIGCRDEGYVSIEVDSISEDEWSDVSKRFDDSSIYQTRSYGTVRWGKDSISHLVLRKRSEIIAAAQVRMISLPLGRPFMAYVSKGPMWRRQGEKADWETFRRVVRALYEEYVSKRNALLRLVPNELRNQQSPVSQILSEEGFREPASDSPGKTIIVDIRPSLDELKRGLHKRWREKLRRAERNDLEIRESVSDDLYQMFNKLYKEMRARKSFTTRVNIDEFRRIQQNLPDQLRMTILMCMSKGQPVSGLIFSTIGNRGIAILSATGNKGLKLYGSYLLRWRMLEKLKQSGCVFLDQGGIDKQLNPGGYAFKSGMGGYESSYISQFDSYNSEMKYCCLRCGEKLRNCIQKIQEKLKTVRGGLVLGDSWTRLLGS